MTPGRPLERAFYERDVLVVAHELLNKVIVRADATEGGRLLTARIVEVEAYREDDPASHSFGGPRGRNRIMFGRGGLLYVYFSYGMHWCMNAVCGPEGQGAAVLLRAAEPLQGVDVMEARRPRARGVRGLCSGPAKLTQALGITGEHDGEDLTGGGPLTLVDDGVPPPAEPGRSPRIGISKAVEEPWRFVVPGSRFLSR